MKGAAEQSNNDKDILIQKPLAPDHQGVADPRRSGLESFARPERQNPKIPIIRVIREIRG